VSQVFPAHWDVLPFSLAVKDATSEYSKLQKSEYLEQGRFPIVDQGQNKFGGYTNDESVVSLEGYPAIVFGDHTRIFKFIDEPFCLGADGAKVLEPKVELDRKFLFYYLSSLNIESAGYSRHFKFLKENVVPVPPLPEQKRIAAILDKADAIRRKRQQAIQLADDFLRAVFLDMFGDPVTNPKGWDVKPLSAGIRSISSGWSASGENRPCSDGEKGVLKISAVTSGVFKPEENKTVPLDQIPEGKKLLFPKRGDLLFSRANTRELVAASCIVMTDVEDVFLPDKLWLVETDQKKLLPEFLNYLLWQPRFKERLTSQATGTSGSMLNISKSKFEETDAFFPNMELQEKFKRIYWALQETLDASASSREAGDSLFESLSQKAFSGQL